MVVGAEERELIRRAVDLRARLRLRTEKAARLSGGCVGCGGDLDEERAGCVTCYRRHKFRRAAKRR
jgi:hypothetical protein